MQRPIRIAFDIGGVLSKYPHIFVPLVNHLIAGGAEVHVITDMHKRDYVLDMLNRNGLGIIPPEQVHNSDYATHGELCKSLILREKEIDVFLDDFPGYLTEGCPVRLQVLPDPREPYFHDDWKTDGSEGDFGRRKKSAK